MMQKLRHEEIPRRSAEAVREGVKHPVYVLLQNIRSMWNVGAIFRTSDAALVEKIIITGYTAVPPRKEIDKTALGATETVCWEYIADPIAAIRQLKSQGVKICALEICEGSRPHTAVTAEAFPLCLVVGNEVGGIDDDVLAHCDLAIEIPQYGAKQSLNVAVSFAVAVYELVRVWRLHAERSGMGVTQT